MRMRTVGWAGVPSVDVKLVIGLCLVVLTDVGIHTPIIQALLKYL